MHKTTLQLTRTALTSYCLNLKRFGSSEIHNTGASIEIWSPTPHVDLQG